MNVCKALITCLLLLLAGIANSNGAVTVTAIEAGGNVVFSGSGTLNLSSLHNLNSAEIYSGINPYELEVPFLALGAPIGNVDEYEWDGILGISVPSPFGTGGWTHPSSGSGDSFGTAAHEWEPGEAVIWVPHGYVSGSWLSGSMTFTGQTFASLELIPGIYTWSWGNGESADSMTLIIPEPSSILLLSFGGLCVLLHRRRV